MGGEHAPGAAGASANPPEQAVVVHLICRATDLLGVPHWSITGHAASVNPTSAQSIEQIVGPAGECVEDFCFELAAVLKDFLSPYLKRPSSSPPAA